MAELNELDNQFVKAIRKGQTADCTRYTINDGVKGIRYFFNSKFTDAVSLSYTSDSGILVKFKDGVLSVPTKGEASKTGRSFRDDMEVAFILGELEVYLLTDNIRHKSGHLASSKDLFKKFTI